VITDFPVLSLATGLPFLGIAAILFLDSGERDRGAAMRRVALATSLGVFALALCVCLDFDRTQSGFQFEEHAEWMPDIGISYHLGVDGISVLFVLLTAVVAPLCILSCWRTARSGLRDILVALLLLESFLIGVFCAVDLVLFYLFFEAAMIPAFMIIGLRGGTGRARAALKLFLFTMVGTLLMLLAVMVLWQKAGSADLPVLMRLRLDPHTQFWLFLAFLAAFGVKMPIWPIHTWQPDAYAEAPTAGSAMMGGVMLNMGAYGLLRFAIPLLPEATHTLSPLVFALAGIGIVYASFVALAQRDMKRLIAYSSVAHMGIITIGLFAANQQGTSGALLQMLSHGVITAAMFLCIGMLQDRVASQDMARFGGVAKVMPGFAAVFMLFTMASVALPGTGDFPAEFLVIVGAWKSSPWLSLGIATSMVLGAAYMLYFYRKVVLGPLAREDLLGLRDLSRREVAMLAPLAVLTLWIGIQPGAFLGFFQASVHTVIRQHAAALAAARVAGL
jgi:NADH-quinone oxidoreductase subunit M